MRPRPLCSPRSWEAWDAWSPLGDYMISGWHGNIHKVDESINLNTSLQCHFICVFYGPFSSSGNLSLVLSVLCPRVPVLGHKGKVVLNLLRTSALKESAHKAQ